MGSPVMFLRRCVSCLCKCWQFYVFHPSSTIDQNPGLMVWNFCVCKQTDLISVYIFLSTLSIWTVVSNLWLYEYLMLCNKISVLFYMLLFAKTYQRYFGIITVWK
jgi:hypothetical protein